MKILPEPTEEEKKRHPIAIEAEKYTLRKINQKINQEKEQVKKGAYLKFSSREQIQDFETLRKKYNLSKSVFFSYLIGLGYERYKSIEIAKDIEIVKE